MKFLEPRWVTLVCDRWSRDKTAMTQLAYFNGVGVDTWQNVWGVFNSMTPHDAEALRLRLRRISSLNLHSLSVVASAEPAGLVVCAGVGVLASRLASE